MTPIEPASSEMSLPPFQVGELLQPTAPVPQTKIVGGVGGDLGQIEVLLEGLNVLRLHLVVADVDHFVRRQASTARTLLVEAEHGDFGGEQLLEAFNETGTPRCGPAIRIRCACRI